jgi:N-acetylmuramoyl-L-alanine amidase
LRKEYPGSKYRFDALFTVGEIYKDDLNDPEEARTTFEDFVHRYPRNHLADDARAAIKGIDSEADEMERTAQKTARKPKSSTGTGGSGGNVTAAAGARNDADSDAAAESSGGSANEATARRSALPRVTGVRHWSTPDYTRVAIDVEQEVKFGSQRISHPDRIFFDLRDTQLASTLVGKTFDVDDGFLKKIRVAEFQPGRTRIVLEVDDLASYDAFLLPDPYRLIIDIHGKKNGTTSIAKTDTANKLHSAPDTATVSPDSDDEVSSNESARLSGTHSKSAVALAKSGLVETDLPADLSANDVKSDAKHSDSVKSENGNRVIKTTVAVKGSNRRIPKTIVEADSGPNDRPNNDRPNDTSNEVGSIADGDDAKTAKSDTTSVPSPAPLHRKKSRAAASAPDTADLAENREARPTATGERSLTRALGLKIGKIVIDAGHGGHDTGTIGPNGLLEKDVVLDVAKRLGRLLDSRLGAEVVYTRQDDTFIPLETRTAIANRERADLFISIHANSSHDSDARGVETYYLNFTSSPEALEVAARENAVSETSIHELQDLVKKIALKEKIEESREFAGDVQASLYGGLALNNAGVRDRGIKKAPFIVLIGANMPSILAEISFVSNPTDERKMETSEHRQRIAESLYRGVSKYVNGLSGVKVASKIDKPVGQ